MPLLDLKPSAQSKGSALQSFRAGQSQRWMQASRDIPHKGTAVLGHSALSVPARKSKEEHEAINSGKERWCCHVGFKKTHIHKNKKGKKKEKEENKPPTRLKWMQNEVTVRECHGMQPLKDSVELPARLLWAFPSMNTDWATWAAQEGLPRKAQPAWEPHSSVWHPPSSVGSHLDKAALSLSLLSEDASKLCLFWDAGSSRTRAGGEEESPAKIIRMGKIKMKSTHSLPLQGKDLVLEMRCTSLCVS